MKNYPGKRTRNWCPRKPINGRCFSYANWKVFMLILQFYLFFTKPLFTVSYSSILFACTVLNLTNQEKNRLERPRKIAQRIIVIDLPNIESRYIKQSIDKVKSLWKTLPTLWIHVISSTAPVSDSATPPPAFHGSEILLSLILFTFSIPLPIVEK